MNLRKFSFVLALWLPLLIPESHSSADQTLLSFEADRSPDLSCTDASASVKKVGTSAVLEVKTGHHEAWPGVTLKPSSDFWNVAAEAELSVELVNPGSHAVTVHCRVDNPGADGTRNCVTASISLSPGQEGSVRVPLKRTADDRLDGKLFGMRGYPVKPGGPGTIDPSKINEVLLFVSKPSADQIFQVVKVSALGRYTPPTASSSDADPFFPFINTFGQYSHKDWPGKVASEADLLRKRDAESDELRRLSSPPGWDEYGGALRGPGRKATGFFHTEKVNGKWWLIDPEGHLFFSHGLDCVRMLDTTPVDEREIWFENFPGQEPEYSEFLSRGYALKGHYAGRSPQCFSFAGANLRRKYGAGWKTECPGVIHRRLRSWGINTIGNWSDEAIRLMRRTPYCDAIGSGRTKMIAGSEGYWGKFPDVFDPSFAESVRQSMEAKKGKSAGDPWCIGFFSDNEMSWGDELSLAIGAAKSPPAQMAKQELLQQLKAKYVDISKLNETWNAHYGSWEALLESRETPDKEHARADLETFYSKLAEQYFRVVREAIKAAAPQQLYLGCRFAWVNARAAAAAAKYCDVVSYNLYQRSVSHFEFNGGADVPLIIGEFHFGALDRGMFHTGLVPVADQQARAKAYKEYVLGALKHPQFVGCHWFQYQDEPVTGRVYDEENYQIGFVDVADTPYAETVEAAREVGAALYQEGK